MTPKPATPELERFVRETLGCTCPAEVFEQVDESLSETSLAAGVEWRVAIGGRLLVYLIAAEDAVAAAARLNEWVSAGLRERDDLGMSRLRLAILLRNPDRGDIDVLERRFAQITASADDRVHLHVLDAASTAVLHQTPATGVELRAGPAD